MPLSSKLRLAAATLGLLSSVATTCRAGQQQGSSRAAAGQQQGSRAAAGQQQEAGGKQG
jgi:hypothetical protein